MDRAVDETPSARHRSARGLTARSARPLPHPEPEVAIAIDGAVVRTFRLGRGFDVVRVDVPPRPQPGVALTIDTVPPYVPGSGDPRRLGIMLDRIVVEPARGIPAWIVPPASAIRTSLIAGGALGGLAVLCGLTWRWLMLVLGVMGTIHAALLLRGLAALLPYAGHVRDWSIAVCVMAAAGLLLTSAGRGWGPALERRFAVLASAVFAHAKFMLLLHPDMVIGDTGFHVNRLKLVLSGEYFFTSVGPGGSFPYPVALYVVAGWLTGLTTDWFTLLRVVVLASDVLAGLVLYVAVARWRSRETALIALVLYHVVPASFQAQAVAYLTNAFAEALTTAALALIAIAAGARRRAVWFAAAGVCATLAFLAHTGSFVILTVTMTLVAGVYRLAGDRDARAASVWVAATLAVALSLSIAMYYGRFVSRLTAPPAATSAAPAAVPVQRAEAHQTQWAPGWVPLVNRGAAVPGYVSKYLGWALVVMATAGAVLLWRARARDPLSLLLAAWVAACVFFLVVGVLTPVDVRYYLAVAPALSVLAARSWELSQNEKWGQSPFLILGQAAVFGWVLVAGVWYWFAWFGPVLPR